MTFLSFVSLYSRDPPQALLHFLNTCRADTRQFFQPAQRTGLLSSIERHARYFAHALVFQKNPLQAYFAGNYLAELLQATPESEPSKHFLNPLRRDLAQLQRICSKQRFSTARPDGAFEEFANCFTPLLAEWRVHSPPLHWLPLASQNSAADLPSNGRVQFVDLWDLTSDGANLISCTASLNLFCFESLSAFLQSLQVPAWRQDLMQKESRCGFWVLDEDLPAQIAAQRGFFSRVKRALAAEAITWPANAEQHRQVLGAQLFGGALDTGQNSKRILWGARDRQFASLLDHLGPECLIPTLLARESARWLATWEVGLSQSFLKPWIEDRLASGARPLPALRSPRGAGPLRLVHVVSQIVDQHHSPTQLLRQLIALRNRQSFRNFVVSTERLAMRRGDYPVCEQISPSSCQRGARTLSWLKEQEVEGYVESSFRGWEATLNPLRDQIWTLEPDILVFHGPDFIHLLLARQFPQSLNVLFEHGSLPEWPGFDLIIASTEDAQQVHGTHCEQIASKLAILPFSVDRRAQWSARPIGKGLLGVSGDDRCAITISNHLEARLSAPFCRVVSAILRNCPDLHYCPIGKVADEKGLRARFGGDIQERLHFYGSCQTPGDLARTADLYFNEFPWGGCLGILDAMAAGCPVISLYDRAGPPQARYGALFMGLDFSARTEAEYLQLAERLVKEPLYYFRASQRAFARYEGKSNLPAYVARFEDALLTNWEAKRAIYPY